MLAPPRGALPPDPLRLQAEGRPHAAALVAGDRMWTYEELDRAAHDLTRQLVESGLDPGCLIGVLTDATPAAIAAVHAVSRSGGIMAPGHARWTESERSAFTEHLRPDAVISRPDAALPADGWIARPVHLPELGGAELLLSQPRERSGPRLQLPVEAHTLVWTSGSEGEPHLVCLGLAAQLHNARGSSLRVSFGPEDGWLASLSLSQVGGLAIVWRSAVVGARIVLGPESFDAERVWAEVKTRHVTHLSVVPVMLRRLLDVSEGESVPDTLRCILVGGDATPLPLVDRALDRRWPIATTYGLTEAASQVTTALPDLVRAKPGTVGAPLDGVRVRIGSGGQIEVAGPTVMLGYAGSGARGEASPIRDGWLHTGDMGRLDEEGHLWVTGRSADRIVSGGANVDPHEVEAILATHERVREAAVVGVPDDVWGERVAAIVETDARSANELEVLESELVRWIESRVSGPRRPRVWVFVQELPRTRTGKPDVAAARELAAEAVSRSE